MTERLHYGGRHDETQKKITGEAPGLTADVRQRGRELYQWICADEHRKARALALYPPCNPVGVELFDLDAEQITRISKTIRHRWRIKMQTARNQPERYEPEQIDDGTMRPEINLDGSPQTPEQMMPQEVQDIIENQREIREQRNAMSEGHRMEYGRILIKKGEAESVYAHYSRDTTASDEQIAAAKIVAAKTGASAAALLLKQKAQMGKLPGDSVSVIEEFLRHANRISKGRGFGPLVKTSRY